MAKTVLQIPLVVLIDVLAHLEPDLMNKLALDKLQVHQIYTLMTYTLGWEIDKVIREPAA